jgi:hypothetical protein
MNRPAIPKSLEREILIEAGHRCAIPVCKQTPVELAHIEPWAKVQEHTFENLIALCPTCHTRYDNGKIDRLSMKHYKANLTILNSRYGDLERRVLFLFAKAETATSIWLPGGLDILLMHIVQDGLLRDTGQDSGVIMAGIPSAKLYAITQSGREFIAKWMNASSLE